MNYLGIDPGKSGGFVLLSPRNHVLRLVKMPDERDVTPVIKSFSDFGLYTCAIEKNSGYVGKRRYRREDGVEVEIGGDTGASMFVFGRATGVVIGVLLALGIKPDEVEPRVWQATFDLRRLKGMGKSAFKRLLRDKAQQFTSMKVPLWGADALLIARWTMLQYEGVAAGTSPFDEVI